jgi:seryl-tRNA synthetase
LTALETQYQNKVAELHKQIAESKARALDAENSLRHEVDSLKAIIANLETRLSEIHILKIELFFTKSTVSR